MPNVEHLDILERGVQIWNQWRTANRHIQPDLEAADLTRRNLPEVDLSGVKLNSATLTRAELVGADLSHADLYQVEFYRANLRSANLDGADLRGAKFHNADLTMASLQNADLFRVDFIGTKLNDAQFAGARCSLTTFASVDLTLLKGLADVVHSGPSNIDISTLLQSVNGAPATFFTNAGVPEDFVRHTRTFLPSRGQFYSVFISYSMNNQDFAELLHADLQQAGIRCSFAPHDIRGGMKIREQIDRAIRLYDRLLLILSEDSMNSEWVKTEIAHARQKEVSENRQVLFPISLVPFDRIRQWQCFDGDTGKDSAREIREYYIPDFSRWMDRDSYRETFMRLVSALAAGKT